MQEYSESQIQPNQSIATDLLHSVLEEAYGCSDEDLERVGSPLVAGEQTIFSMSQRNCAC